MMRSIGKKSAAALVPAVAAFVLLIVGMMNDKKSLQQQNKSTADHQVTVHHHDQANHQQLSAPTPNTTVGATVSSLNKNHHVHTTGASATVQAGTEMVTKDHRIIFFLHIHKNGGNTMCAAAHNNRVPAQKNNTCNVQKNLRCCGNGDSLEHQQQFAKSTPYKFVACEGDMYESMDRENYRYVIQLRDSQSRYRSHWKHVYRENKRPGIFSYWWQGQPDNWTVRKICGTKCMKTRKFQISKGQFEYTLQRLQKFDDIIFLENYGETFRKFATRVGWKEHQKALNVDTKLRYPNEGQEWDPLMSVLDDALYEYALQLYDGIKEPVLPQNQLNRTAEYFELGPNRSCANVCCSKKCSPYR